jgi:5'(3')-deoxyribonucleotidase
LNNKNVLNEEDRDILKVFHYMRNESYHTGAIKSRVLPSVTRLSHNKACELLKLLSPPLFHHQYSNNYVQNSVDKYSNEFKIGIKDLAKDLSKDLLIRIKSVLENLCMVCLGNIELEDENQVNNMLIWVQSTY